MLRFDDQILFSGASLDTVIRGISMKNEKKSNKSVENNKESAVKGNFSGDPSEMRKAPGYSESVPGVNTPTISLPGKNAKHEVVPPAFNPPVPNRAWTEMRKNLQIESLTEEEKRRLYVGRTDNF